MKKTGRITIPTDSNFTRGTKEIMEKWGADAVRDCDGTKLPNNPKELADRVYETYFVTRGDVEFAKANPEELQHFFLMSEKATAFSSKLEINLLRGYYKEQIRLDFSAESIKYWQVMDRTTGQEHTDFLANEKNNTVTINNAKEFHEYTVSFMAYNIWDSTQMYNYITNNWDIDKHSPYDPRYPKTKAHIKLSLIKWLKENPDISVVRFTTFLYHFFLVFNESGKEKVVDWFGYNASVSPKALDDFEKAYGYKLKAEDLIDEGYYNNPHRIPKKPFLKAYGNQME